MYINLLVHVFHKLYKNMDAKIYQMRCSWKGKNGVKKGKFANCARPSRFPAIKFVMTYKPYLNTTL